MMRIFNVLIMAVFFASSGFAELELFKGWMDDVEAAQKVARESNSPLLIAFLGPNWCSYSDKLEKEILSQSRLIRLLGKEMVLVKIDIPEDFEEGSYYGKELKEAFHVDQCPCVTLADQNACVIAKLDPLPVSCEHFVRSVKQVLKDFDRVSHLERRELRQMKVDELKHLYARAGHLADTTFKKVLMKQGLKVDRGPYFLVEEYGRMLASGAYSKRKLKKIRNKVLARDPENEQGCLRRLALFDFESRIGVQSPEEVIAPLVQYLSEFGVKDGENAWKLEMKISQYLFGKDRIKEALKHARSSYDLAPSDSKQEIAQSIEYLKTFVR